MTPFLDSLTGPKAISAGSSDESEVGLRCVRMVAELEWKISAIALLGAAVQADAYASFGGRLRQVLDAKKHSKAFGNFIR